MLDSLLILFSAAMSQTALCLFSLSKGFFVGATSLVLQQQLPQFLLHVLHMQPHVLTDGLTCKPTSVMVA
jgi:hypothetical protein